MSVTLAIAAAVVLAVLIAAGIVAVIGPPHSSASDDIPAGEDVESEQRTHAKPYGNRPRQVNRLPRGGDQAQPE
jgi:hypothetical protein